MDGLKQSLEMAIKELQDTPAGAKPNPPVAGNSRHEQMRAPTSAPVQQSASSKPHAPAPVSSGQGVLGQVAPRKGLVLGQDFPPAKHSIEAALASAPAVSPHYVAPPPPPPAPVAPVVSPIEVPLLTPRIDASGTPAEQRMGRANTRPGENAMAGAAGSTMAHSELRQGRARPPVPAPATVTGQRGGNRISATDRSGTARSRDTASHGLDPGNVADLAAGVGQQARMLKDNIWRWATIGISCAGGLASGWLGSSVSDQANGLLQSGVQTVVEKASDGLEAKMPAVLKLASNGKSDYLTGGQSGQLTGQLTGKTDRALPLDDNLCTVLELDRGTGLTLAKPCKPVETARFGSTLRGADLLVQPR